MMQSPMDKIYIIDGLEAKIDMNSVLRTINCKPDNPVYEEIVKEYQVMHQEIQDLVEPVGILGFGELTELTATEEYGAGTPVIYGVIGVGDKIKKYGTQAFQEGDYVRGMLCDAMADSALFSLEGRMQEKLKEICKEHHVGIIKRLEAPHDISMEIQKEAWERLELEKRLGIGITSGYMFDPVKTCCQVFVLTKDVSQFKAGHDCRKCPNKDCLYRDIPEVEITVQTENKAQKFQDNRKLTLRKEESLMEGLHRYGYGISAACGGKGRCGKCKIQVLDGNAKISTEDECFFSKSELEEGWRLSCTLYPEEDLTIAVEVNDESEFEAVSEYLGEDYSRRKYEESAPEEYEMAIDIGTTTIAFQLLSKKNGRIHGTLTAVNNQRKYGADVISRIQASIDGKKEELKECICGDLRSGIIKLLETVGAELDQLERIAISCNTTMSHLLLGYDCNSLGIYPFTPVEIGFIRGSMEEIIGMPGKAEVVVLPGISTFVGGDIVSGLYVCEFDKTDDIYLLVDLGTNGEMALGNRRKILVTSTAAGPAFEGGNITWGMGSVAGAISSVKLEKTKAIVETIKEKSPVGICGTGVVEAVAELLREEVIDETGLLEEEYFEEGFPLAVTEDGKKIVLTQKDIRELQLAKAAIRAGIETLLIRYGIDKGQVSQVYLAGGFGFKLDISKAIAIGLLPEDFASCTQAVGNSSLAGAVKYLINEHSEKAFHQLIEISQEISLSTDPDFNECYMDSMMFESL